MRLLLLTNSFLFFGQAVHSITPSLRNVSADVEEQYTLGAKMDRIVDLPGLNKESKLKQFSGYLTVDEKTNRSIFYWYVESLSDPSTDPVVLWTNGGPGCSGLLGFGTEQGPYHIQKDGTLKTNPYAWNNIANMLYVEQPAGVGFSFSDDADDYHTGDEQAAVDNYELLKQFLQKFPERKENKLYIASESYGGHYMPQLAEQILKKNTDNSINFKGFLVGNPYVDSYSNSVAQYRQMYYDGLIPKPLYDQYEEKCTKGKARFIVNLCPDIEALMMVEMGSGINPYALDYPVCTDSSPSRKIQSGSQGLKLLHHTLDQSIIQKAFLHDIYLNPYEPCREEYLLSYLNRKDVRKAIHAEEGVGKWSSCSHKVHYKASDRFVSQVDLYKELVTGGHNLDILVYSGDDDSICPTSGTQDWIFDLGVKPKPARLWSPWHSEDSQIAGYTTHFEVESGTFTFATVHGAGHEVPAYKPRQAYLLFENFLNGNV